MIVIGTFMCSHCGMMFSSKNRRIRYEIKNNEMYCYFCSKYCLRNYINSYGIKFPIKTKRTYFKSLKQDEVILEK